MANRSGYSSGSESDEPPNPVNNTIPGNSFSIENLLARTQPSSFIRWGRNESFLSGLTPKQVCPIPPNILVPSNLFRRPSARKNVNRLTLEIQEPSHDEDSTDQLFQADDGDNDSDQNTNNDNNGNSVSLLNDDEGDSLVPLDGQSALYKKKRPRTAFSVSQIRTLETEFERNRYLTGSKRKELSKQLSLSETQIKIWFQNRRTKLKRKNVSEMETWVQQFYSPLGPMAPRPLVIGDRLYLFNNPGANAPPPPPPSYFPITPVFDAWRQGPSWQQ